MATRSKRLVTPAAKLTRPAASQLLPLNTSSVLAVSVPMLALPLCREGVNEMAKLEGLERLTCNTALGEASLTVTEDIATEGASLSVERFSGLTLLVS